jgi:predicted RNA binding protein YcfA (HicA-like mRNA interferase family)
MTPRLPRVKPRKVIKALQSLGFVHERSSGSHMIFVHPDGRVIPLPFHSDRTLKPGLLRRIIRDAGVSVEEFRRRMR